MFEDTFRTTGCVRIYTPGEPQYSVITLYSSALNDPPEYVTDNSTLPQYNISGRDVHTLDTLSELIYHRG